MVVGIVQLAGTYALCVLLSSSAVLDLNSMDGTHSKAPHLANLCNITIEAAFEAPSISLLQVNSNECARESLRRRSRLSEHLGMTNGPGDKPLARFPFCKYLKQAYRVFAATAIFATQSGVSVATASSSRVSKWARFRCRAPRKCPPPTL